MLQSHNAFPLALVKSKFSDGQKEIFDPSVGPEHDTATTVDANSLLIVREPDSMPYSEENHIIVNGASRKV